MSRIHSRAGQAGFTLAEALAALTFMAILVPVALEGLHIASRAGEVAARKSEATLVAQDMLNQALIVTNTFLTSQSGQTRQGIHDFRWTVQTEPWNQDSYLPSMELVTAEVTYNVQGQQYSVRLNTLLDSSPPFLQPTNSP
ncbi:MAG TPA: type II secretion system protein [Verrucomicrobiae bacterium]|nr:type II secretion system protein [Verrucomicrobiae bacterium]